MPETNFTPAELYDAWPVLSMEERVEGERAIRFQPGFCGCKHKVEPWSSTLRVRFKV
jgi:hypothetical protein